MSKKHKAARTKNALVGLCALIASLALAYASFAGLLVIPDESNDSSPALTQATENSSDNAASDGQNDASVTGDVYTFRKHKHLQEHYEKHGIEMGFSSPEEYQAAASAVAENPNSLHKLEAEDGDDVYYLEATNEFVIVSTDGYLRTYFCPNDGKAYFDRQ